MKTYVVGVSVPINRYRCHKDSVVGGKMTRPHELYHMELGKVGLGVEH